MTTRCEQCEYGLKQINFASPKKCIECDASNLGVTKNRKQLMNIQNFQSIIQEARRSIRQLADSSRSYTRYDVRKVDFNAPGLSIHKDLDEMAGCESEANESQTIVFSEDSGSDSEDPEPDCRRTTHKKFPTRHSAVDLNRSQKKGEAKNASTARKIVKTPSFDEFADSAFVRVSQLVLSPQRPSHAAPLPFSAPTLWRKVKAGTFPKPIKLSERVTCWRVGEVRAWMIEQAVAQGVRDAV